MGDGVLIEFPSAVVRRRRARSRFKNAMDAVEAAKPRGRAAALPHRHQSGRRHHRGRRHLRRRRQRRRAACKRWRRSAASPCRATCAIRWRAKCAAEFEDLGAAHGQEHRAPGACISRVRAPKPNTAAAPGAERVPEHFDLRAAVRQYERRRRAGIFLRRHQRRHHHRPEQGVGACRSSRATRAFTFKGKHVDMPQVARQLKVSHVLEGSVRKSGKRVRITAQLIDGRATTTSGPSATTATSTTSSRCRTRSRRPSSRR